MQTSLAPRASLGRQPTATLPMPARAFATYRYFGTFRFALACLVMVQHFGSNAAPMAVTLAVRPLELGNLAVLVFFCLSGFVITEAADIAYQGRPLAFMSNRCIRLFPHFIIALTLSIILQKLLVNSLHLERMLTVQVPPDFTLGNMLANYLDIIPFSEKIIQYHFISIAWAVRTEMVFYITVAVCLVGSKKFLTFPKMLLLVLGVMTLAFILSVLHHAPLSFGFVPYFTYGGALYYALKGEQIGKWLVLACIPAMAVQFLTQPWYHPLGFMRDVPVEFGILCTLIAVFTGLALLPQLRRWGKTDNWIGGITYPLYLYHLVILIPVTSLFTDYSNDIFIGGMLASILFSAAMLLRVDPTVDRYRDWIRGRRLMP